MTNLEYLKRVKKTYVVNGRLAINTQRYFEASKPGNGGQVMAIEHVAARLAGGFLEMIDMPTLRELVTQVLPDTDMGELEAIKDRPSVPQAAARSLMKFWMSGVDPQTIEHHPRMQAILALEHAVLAVMPANLKRPGDLRDMAVSRAANTTLIFGEVIIRNMTNLHPVWQPMIKAMAINHLASHPMIWEAGPRPVPDWIKEVCEVQTANPTKPVISAQTVANARHEVVEAIRWLRSRLAADAQPGELAIATTSTSTYDALFVAAAAEADLKIHFVHGVSAVHTKQGQTAAALADILLRGISQKRVRRLFDLMGQRSPLLKELPADWGKALKPDAALTTAKRWETALENQRHAAIKAVVLPVIGLLSRDISEASFIGSEILPPEALSIWNRALKDGPAPALDRTIKAIRINDDVSPLLMPCFMSAEHLAASPRAEVMLIGMNSENWPRGSQEDGLIPDHIVPTAVLDPMPISSLDEADFKTICDTTERALIISWPRRDADGRRCEPSGLIRSEIAARAVELGRSRRAPSAMSDADRLFCRPDEFSARPEAIKAHAVISNWTKDDWTEHDGLIAPGNPRILAVLDQVQSATSLRKLLRDPIGFVWQYALGFRAPEYEDEPLLLDSRQQGNLLHDILQQAVARLEKQGGLAGATRETIENTIEIAWREVARQTEAAQPVPPEVIWKQTLRGNARLATNALSYPFAPLREQVTMCEVPFGSEDNNIIEGVPLFENPMVIIPGTNIRISGRMDRVDRSADPHGRIIDYKSGKTPKDLPNLVFKGGDEVQRPFYYMVAKALMPEMETIEVGLFYPITGDYAPLPDPDEKVAVLIEYVKVACQNLIDGYVVPGPATKDTFNGLVFALPANARATYLDRAISRAEQNLKKIAELWGAE